MSINRVNRLCLSIIIVLAIGYMLTGWVSLLIVFCLLPIPYMAWLTLQVVHHDDEEDEEENEETEWDRF